MKLVTVCALLDEISYCVRCWMKLVTVCALLDEISYCVCVAE